MLTKLLVSSVTLLVVCSFSVRATEPIIGGWRLVENHARTHEYRFAMLPQPVPGGTQFVAVDWTARKLVCCLAVQGKEISEDSLRNKFHIPEVWIADLMNHWNLEQAPYRPRLFMLTADAAFLAHKFTGESTFMNGGLLLPVDSHVTSQGHLMINQERYRGKFIERPLADDDGAVYIYTLRPSSGGKQVVVEVPFGNN
jgi:hypothetical protein